MEGEGRSRGLRPHQQIGLLALAAIVAVATVFLVMVVRLGEIGTAQAHAAALLRRSGSTAAARAAVASAQHRASIAHRDLLITSAVELVFLLGTFGFVFRLILRRDRELRVADVARRRDAYRNDLETRLQRALEIVRTEELVYERLGRAIAETAPDQPAELLVADSSRAHFRQVLGTPDDAGGCQVGSPSECPAATRGQTQRFHSSRALDACPYLDGRPVGPCSATCVPVSIGGKTIGVVHVTGPDARPVGDDEVDNLEIIARKAGERLGVLRAFSRSETQAQTDQLTGLLNRRSLEARVHDLARDGRTYTVAFGDLDHFKQLNDVHGHDAGDRALRLFSRVLRDAIRPTDIAARYGGEEFVVVVPDSTTGATVAMLERVRERLALAQHHGTVPPFTVSFGVADSLAAHDFDETVGLADRALLEAKRAGRNRTIAHSEGGHHDGAPIPLAVVAAPADGPDPRDAA
jgi:diguanylate cyclase (GGDEF)-like protein